MGNPANIFVIGDTHFPFEKKGYLDFCLETHKKFDCGQVVHVGDLVDNHSLSYHEHSPDGFSPLEEIKKAKQRIKEWFKAFPKVKVCKGNHDILVERKAITNGFPRDVIKSFRETWEVPDEWEYEWSYYICGVRFEHGTGYSGLYPQLAAAKNNRQSTVIGHCHSVAGTIYHANDRDLLFGLSVGCGIDRMKYAFWYGKDFRNKPILGCGVILGGREGHFVPMKI